MDDQGYCVQASYLPDHIFDKGSVFIKQETVSSAAS